MTTVVYFAAAGNPPEAVKIGHTRDVGSRIASIQTGNALCVRLIGTVRGDHRFERALHARFAHLHLRGEWFHWTEEIATFVEDLDLPFSGFDADAPFVGLLGRGYDRSFYRAFVRDPGGQWWRFGSTTEPTPSDPVERQRKLGPAGVATVYGKLADAAGFDGKPDSPALLRVLARAREVAVGR